MALQKKTRLDSGNRFMFQNKGDKLVGHYTATDEVDTSYGRAKRHAINTAEGLTTFLGNAQINQDLSEVPPGTYVEIELTGTKKVKRGTMKVFDFSFDLADVDTSGAAEASLLSEGSVDSDAIGAEEEREEPQLPPPARVTSSPAVVDKARQDRARNMLSKRR